MKLAKGSLRALCIALAVLLASPALAGVHILQAGVIDSFAPPTDPSSPSPSIVALLGGGNALDDFDAVTENDNVAHTFTNLPQGIVSGTLTVRVRATGGNPETDGVALSFVTPASPTYKSAIAWARNFGPCACPGGGVFGPNDPGLQAMTWQPPLDQVFVVDLAALPLAAGGTMDLIPLLNQHGFVDVLTGDDSTTDYYTLELTTASQVPALGTGGVWVLAGLLVGSCILITVGRRSTRRRG